MPDPKPSDNEDIHGQGSQNSANNRIQQQAATARLIIEEPRPSDEALYKCDVTYVRGKCPSISLVKVSIVSLPSKAQISQLLGPQQQQPLAEGQLIGPLNEHEQLRLSCLVLGGRPQPRSVIWRKIDQSGRIINLINNNKLINQMTQIQVDLNHTLSSSDLGAKFECHVDHEALDEASAARAVVVATERGEKSSNLVDSMLDLHPGIPLEEPESAPQEAGQQQQQQQRSLDSHILIDLNVGVASLDLFMSKVNKLNSSDSLREGDLVELECIAYNSKPPANITWFNGSEMIEQLDGSSRLNNYQPSGRHKRLLQRNQIHKNLDSQTFNSHSILSIKLSRHENKAQITCQAQNGLMRQPIVKSFELSVQHPPIVLMEPAAGIVVNEAKQASSTGDNQFPVNIYCIYSANPNELVPNSTRWFKDGQLISNLDDQEATNRVAESVTPTGYPMLTIKSPNKNDAGLYDCQVSNLIGFSERVPSSESCRVEVNFKPIVGLRLMKPVSANSLDTDQATKQATPQNFPNEELVEVDPNQELVVAGKSYVLKCDVLEAQPGKILKYYWYKQQTVKSSSTAASLAFNNVHHLPSQTGGGRAAFSLSGSNWPPLNGNFIQETSVSERFLAKEIQLMSVTDRDQLVLSPLQGNFSLTGYACSASNLLGTSELSNKIELQLSYNPGPSFVRSINNATIVRSLLAAGKVATSLQSAPGTVNSMENLESLTSLAQPIQADRELLLECVTPNLGQPMANLWLWYHNNQPIESSTSQLSRQQPESPSPGETGGAKFNKLSMVNSNSDNGEDERIIPLAKDNNNPISDQELYESSASTLTNENHHHRRRQQHRERISGNRNVSDLMEPMEEFAGKQQSGTKLLNSGRYLFIPSIQLAHKGNYSCVAVSRLGPGSKKNNLQPTSKFNSDFERDPYQLRVALRPTFIKPLPAKIYWSESSKSPNEYDSKQMPSLELVCHIQCDPICQIEWLINNEPLDPQRQTETLASNYVQYQIKQSIMDENSTLNLFKSIESRLELKFNDNLSTMDVKKVLERRHLLSGIDYTCQSNSNSVGPPIRSTTKFVVQYPPENVIINAPSDKLNFVEGGNGPRLVCMASGEPQVQYRWFLLKNTGAGGRGSDVGEAIYKNNNPRRHADAKTLSKAPGNSDSLSAKGGSQAINQLVMGATEPLAALTILEARNANDSLANLSPALLKFLESDNLVSLEASISEQGGGSSQAGKVSVLDLSSNSLNRRQSGHYICEATNRLGRVQQSVYVNVLYKPTCATLHLHSLDLTIDDYGVTNNNNVQLIGPHEASIKDEYQIVRETNEDFMDLRRMLIMSPIVDRQFSKLMNGTNGQEESISLTRNIFETILNDKRSFEYVKTKDALINDQSDNASENANNHLVQVGRESNSSRIKTQQDADSWNRFNGILLKFLNNYIRNVKNSELRSSLMMKASRRQQNRRSHPNQWKQELNSSGQETDNSNNIVEPKKATATTTSNIITFACVAQDANPMNNLTFDWSFGSSSLMETINADDDYDNPLNEHERSYGHSGDQKSTLLYSNDNYTLHVVFVRRYDTKSSLNPFQVSLVTLNVIVGSTSDDLLPMAPMRSGRRNTRQEVVEFSSQNNKTFKAPILRNRYKSLFNDIDSNNNLDRNGQVDQNNNAANDNNRVFNSRFPSSVELNERNWQEQIGDLLKCSISNQIGTSNVCGAQLNLVERSRAFNQKSPASFEFAKWRMPSLAHKSLLIISILIGCALVIFIVSALLLGPHLKNLSLKRNENSRGKAVGDNNNGNGKISTNSQKSSMLGLLSATGSGGCGDNSTQGSSDDDYSSSRLASNQSAGSNRLLRDAQLLHVIKSNQTYLQDARDLTAAMSNYDKPRDLRDQMLSSARENLCYNERIVDGCIGDVDQISGNFQNNQLPNYSNELNLRQVEKLDKPSAGSRLLANLKFKSLSSRFKVDRISDLANFTSTNSHRKHPSNAETNTTGLSTSGLDSNLGELSAKISSPTSSNSSTAFFGEPNARHSYSGIRSTQYSFNRNQQQTKLGALQQHLHDQNSSQMASNDLSKRQSRMMELNSSGLLDRIGISTSGNGYPTPTSANNLFNPLDRFIQQREMVEPVEIINGNSADAFAYRNQSVRSFNTNNAMQMLRKDPTLPMSNYQQALAPINRGPPVYPRTMSAQQQVQGGLYNRASDLSSSLRRPQIAARSRNLLQQTIANSTDLYRYSMANSFNQSYDVDIGESSTNYMDTIDSHLNRLPFNNQIAGIGQNHYQNHQQLAYLNQLNAGQAQQQTTASLSFNHHSDANNQTSVEHIYDTNAYATPEQTPQKRLQNFEQQGAANERLRVSQLIQSFNLKAPE